MKVDRVEKIIDVVQLELTLDEAKWLKDYMLNLRVAIDAYKDTDLTVVNRNKLIQVLDEEILT